jgi:predicted kinase
MLVLMAGLPGTGKSTLARELALRVSGTVLDKDAIRQVLFEPRDLEYSTQQDDFVMQIMLQTVAWLFARDPKRVVFLDGRPFSRNSQIEHVQQFAASQQQPWRILECVCSEATAHQRLESQRSSSIHPAANRDFDLYRSVRERFEPIPAPKTVIDTDTSLNACVEVALQALR